MCQTVHNKDHSNLQCTREIVEKKSANLRCIIQHAVYFIVCKPIVQNGTPKWKIKGN
jgi:hypothetical protein